MATYIIRRCFADPAMSPAPQPEKKDNHTGAKILGAAAVTAGVLAGRRMGAFGNKAMMTSNARWANIGNKVGWKSLQTSSVKNMGTALNKQLVSKGATETLANKTSKDFVKTMNQQFGKKGPGKIFTSETKDVMKNVGIQSKGANKGQLTNKFTNSIGNIGSTAKQEAAKAAQTAAK